MLHNGGSSGPGRSVILGKQTKKSQNEEQPAGQAKQNRAFLLAQSLDLYGSANDPRTANDPGPQMIPKLDRK